MYQKAFVLALSAALLCSAITLSAETIPGQYIIRYRDTGRFGVSSGIRDASARFRSSSTLKSLSSPLKLLRTSKSGKSFCSELKRRLPEISVCSPDQRYTANLTPDDTYYSGYMWGLPDIGAPSAWDISTGSSDVIVGIIDTGIDYTHPDLSANIWTNPNETENGLDDDGNGFIDDLHGANLITDDGDPMDDHSHGTHVAGTIGAAGNNGTGVTGINWNVKLMGLKFLDADGSGSTSDAIEAIQYLIDQRANGIDVRFSNNSWGGGSPDEALNSAISDLSDAGVIFIAAAGNDTNNNDANPTSPAGHEDAVTVAAIDSNHALASFSNYGLTSVNIAAPGVDIASTIPVDIAEYYDMTPYSYMSGTSMASPHVTGALALALAANPALGNNQLKTLLYKTGTSYPALMYKTSTGRSLNLASLISSASTAVPTEDPADAASVSSFSMLSVSGSALSTRVKRGSKFALSVIGSGNGYVKSNFYFDGTKCEGISYKLTNGLARLIGTVPKKLSAAKSMKIRSGSRRSSAKLTGSKGSLSAKASCRKLVRSLRASA